MSKLRVRPTEPDSSGQVLNITPESAGWSYVGFQVYRLTPGQRLTGIEPAREACLIVLTGVADVIAATERFEAIGGRRSVFDDASPAAVFIPPQTRYTVIARNAVELAVCPSPAHGGNIRLIEPDSIGVEKRGAGTNARLVRNILPETEPAESLLIAEVITPGGHWSSYPPHRHDTDALPAQSALEETYYHKLNPRQGFAFQRVYTDDRSIDETICVEDGDVVLVPRGYHPVGAPHGYDLYYLNVMAGPKRTWLIANDPAHEWMLRKS
jgi:5-deoxy-glucuronate isomerase